MQELPGVLMSALGGKLTLDPIVSDSDQMDRARFSFRAYGVLQGSFRQSDERRRFARCRGFRRRSHRLTDAMSDVRHGSRVAER